MLQCCTYFQLLRSATLVDQKLNIFLQYEYSDTIKISRIDQKHLLIERYVFTPQQSLKECIRENSWNWNTLQSFSFNYQYISVANGDTQISSPDSS